MRKHLQYKNGAIYKLGKFACLLLIGACMMSINTYAAKGDAKNKKGVVLKFSGFGLNLKNTTSLSLFSKSSFLYNGSFSGMEKTAQRSDNANWRAIVTFQKGNTTFIYPYQYKVKMPLFKTPAPVQR